jgi:Rap1a immunity proteins
MPKSVAGLFGAAALAVTVTAAPAAEDVTSANFVLPHCRGFINRSIPNDPAALIAQGYCLGFIEGVVYGGGKAICVPRGVTTGQGFKVVIAYIEARPARMHEPFRGLALEALRDAWPCR